MKKLLFILIFLLVIACSEKKTESKQSEEKNAGKMDTVSIKEEGSKKEDSYESSLLKRMETLEAELKPALDSGITSDMVNASSALSEAWEAELNKVYKLLMAELPENEKVKLRTAQREWIKKRKIEAEKEAKEFEGGTIANLLSSGTELELTTERTIELAKMYDDLHK
ncbi:MAG: lysozyme inhibitor LprI family protein [Leptotrichiaceae bacterium]|nr:lysozyme inhibitor LprI family protein [Leptotrichiaceae bacterium]